MENVRALLADWEARIRKEEKNDGRKRSEREQGIFLAHLKDCKKLKTAIKKDQENKSIWGHNGIGKSWQVCKSCGYKISSNFCSKCMSAPLEKK